MSNETENKYPEHEKLTKVKDQSQTIGGFLESMGEQGLVLAEYVAADEYSEARLVPVNKSINNRYLYTKYRPEIKDYLLKEFNISLDPTPEQIAERVARADKILKEAGLIWNKGKNMIAVLLPLLLLQKRLIKK